MKKSFLTLIFVTVVLSVIAQSPFTLGIKGSINSSKITTENPSVSDYTYSDFKSDTKAGFNVGAFARLGNKIYLQPELLYCQRNGKTSFMSPTNTTGSQTIELRTIQVPVLLGVKVVNLQLVSIHAFTGPAMSFVLSSSDIKIDDVTTPLFDTKNYKNNIWDWQAGAGVDIGMFTFDVRYEWGLTNVSDGDGDISNVGFKNKGNMLTFSLGFKFL